MDVHHHIGDGAEQSRHDNPKRMSMQSAPCENHESLAFIVNDLDD
jgi:hypothetical protein